MQKKNSGIFWIRMLAFLLSGLIIAATHAGTPLWTFEPLTATTVAVPANSTAIVQYRVTNQSQKPHTLVMKSTPGVTQITSGLGVCGSTFGLQGKGSCVLSLQVNGGELSSPITDGPVVCQQGSNLQCYGPDFANVLSITPSPPILDTIITVTGSPLTLTAFGASGQLTITNTSTQVSATNIVSNFTGTALQGNVTETGNTCANIAPGGSCTLTYTPGNTVVPQTDFTIQGTNTNVLTAVIAIQQNSVLISINPTSGTASGGTGFTLTGTGLTGATGITFDGIAATNVNVVNSTTVTGVTPAHAVGVVDVVIDTPVGGATLANAYTYSATAVGQPTGGGIIACLNGGLNNLITTTTDNSGSIQWGGSGVAIGALAQSNTDGATNTATIVVVVGNNGGVPYAAQLCNDYEVDSLGNTPCQPGNACYNDWFLPAGGFNATPTGQLNCLYVNSVALGGFAAAYYWSSTEFSGFPTLAATGQNIGDGNQGASNKNTNQRIRCVRAFTP